MSSPGDACKQRRLISQNPSSYLHNCAHCLRVCERPAKRQHSIEVHMSGSETFWFCVGALVAASLAFVVPSLWRSLNSVPRWARYTSTAIFVFAFTIGSLWLYDSLGTPPSRDLAKAHQAFAPNPPQVSSSIADVTKRLAARLQSEGGSDSEWELLATAYEQSGAVSAASAAREHRVVPSSVEAAPGAWSTKAERARRERRFADAKAAFEEGIGTNEMTADSWADYADAIASLSGTLKGPPADAVDKALALDPQHKKALWLHASVAIEERRYDDALAGWQRLRAVIPDESPDARIVDANIAEARTMSQDTPAVAVSRTASIHGEVAIDPALRARVKNGFTLFIYAKAVDQSGPPVAVLRVQTLDWPIQFSLDDSHAMIPGRSLSAFDRVLVEARVSASNDALAKPGDLSAPGTVVDPRRAPKIKLKLSKVVG